MQLLMVGLNHKTAPIEIREKFAFAGQLLTDAVRDIASSTGINCGVLLSTCNRTELYVQAKSLRALRDWLWRERGLRIGDLSKYTYLYRNRQVVRHLMTVASGLDSMVLGEVEILGQLKESYAKASAVGCLGKTLDKLFQAAFAVAKRVRTQTEISVNPVSIAYLAVRLAERIFTRTSNKRVLLVGAGATARLLVQHLCGSGVQEFVIANRTLDKSKGIAGEVASDRNIKFIELSQVPDFLSQADIVVTATSAPLPIIGKGSVELAMKERKQRSMFMIDVAIPRNIEPQVRGIANVYLYSIDDLQSIAAEHRKTRYNAAQQALEMINVEVDNFMCWLQAQNVIGLIQAFRQLCEQKRDEALVIAKRQLQAGHDPELVNQRLAYSLLNKILHVPTVQMRNASMLGDIEFLEYVQRLFNVETEI